MPNIWKLYLWCYESSFPKNFMSSVYLDNKWIKKQMYVSTKYKTEGPSAFKLWFDESTTLGTFMFQAKCRRLTDPNLSWLSTMLRRNLHSFRGMSIMHLNYPTHDSRKTSFIHSHYKRYIVIPKCQKILTKGFKVARENGPTNNYRSRTLLKWTSFSTLIMHSCLKVCHSLRGLILVC